MLTEDQRVKVLSTVPGNYSVQSNNITVLKLVLQLVEIGFFKVVHFVFLVFSDTKNTADRLVNDWKKDYHNKNLYVMEQDLLHYKFLRACQFIRQKRTTFMIEMGHSVSVTFHFQKNANHMFPAILKRIFCHSILSLKQQEMTGVAVLSKGPTQNDMSNMSCWKYVQKVSNFRAKNVLPKHL